MDSGENHVFHRNPNFEICKISKLLCSGSARFPRSGKARPRKLQAQYAVSGCAGLRPRRPVPDCPARLPVDRSERWLRAAASRQAPPPAPASGARLRGCPVPRRPGGPWPSSRARTISSTPRFSCLMGTLKASSVSWGQSCSRRSSFQVTALTRICSAFPIVVYRMC